ncbi:MAG: nucleoside kinase [Lachnospiraceae bacterium]|nr:nucleoside kinase [Sarcina sp.]MBQ6589961.1 nucleoside kinase [Lachnospiraceae bacterium]
MPTVMINGAIRQYDKGTTFESIVREYQPKYNYSIALVYFNGKMRELSKRLERDGALSFITTTDYAGFNAYVRTAQMMMVKAVSEILGETGKEARVKIEFSLGNACFCSVKGGMRATPELAEKIEERMRLYTEKNIPVIKKTYPIDDAIELFRHQGMKDKEKLFHYRRSSTVNVYRMEGYSDYFYGYMLPSTGYVRNYHIQAYKGGLLLILPGMDDPSTVKDFVDQPSLFDQLMLSTQWGDLVNISTVGDLNEQICNGSISDMILVQEALQERRIGDIAREIVERGKIRFVLVAGPSSSGKTTFSHRLAIQLKSFGLRPHIISMDDYFVDRDRTPVDIDGNYNFDVIEAVDLELFNADMVDLLNGETIEMPHFDFKSGRRVYKGDFLKFEENDILVIEGIHGLNPVSTEQLPEENKFKIYISALTSLNIDEHNRIPSTDARLLRRMVRDHRTRSYSAQETLRSWKKVREGEEINIYPYQEGADAVFNSVLIYELAVIKQFAEPLLLGVRTNEPEYYEAKRLIKFLDYFVGIDPTPVPGNSLCREFVGGGIFPV